jgi:uncharacterized membrane protein
MNEEDYKDLIKHWFTRYSNNFGQNANMFLKDLLIKSNLENPQTILIENIRELVLVTELITKDQLMQYSRKRDISVQPRQIYAHLLIKYIKGYSLNKLGTYVRNKPYIHCDMIHCNKVIENLCSYNNNFKVKIENYYNIIDSWKI